MTKAAWNVMLYTIAGDRKELDRITGAIDDMHASATAAQCNVAVQVHAKGKTQRSWISAGRKLQVETLPIPVDAGDPVSLKNFLDAVHQRFAASSSALVLWAHGSGIDPMGDAPSAAMQAEAASPSSRGSMRVPSADLQQVFGGSPQNDDGRVVHEPARDRKEPPDGSAGCRWGPDPNTRHYLTNVAMKRAIAASVRHRVDLFGLNACSMASLECEYELRNVCSIQVASQVEAQPWPYGEIIRALAARPSLSARELGAAIVAIIQAGITGPDNKRSDTVSAMASGTALEEVAAELDGCAKQLVPMIDTGWHAISQAVAKAQRVDDPDQVDLTSLLHELGQHEPKIKIAAEAVEAKLRSALVAYASNANHPGAHGLSVFFPDGTHADIAASYRGTDFRTNHWVQFLRAYQIKLARSPAPDSRTTLLHGQDR